MIPRPVRREVAVTVLGTYPTLTLELALECPGDCPACEAASWFDLKVGTVMFFCYRSPSGIPRVRRVECVRLDAIALSLNCTESTADAAARELVAPPRALPAPSTRDRNAAH